MVRGSMVSFVLVGSRKIEGIAWPQSQRGQQIEGTCRSRWRNVTFDPFVNATWLLNAFFVEKVHVTPPSSDHAWPPAAPLLFFSTSEWKIAWNDPGWLALAGATHMCASSMCVLVAAGCPWKMEVVFQV